MKGAIFFASKYGSTAKYASWIADETDLPTFYADGWITNASALDFLVLISPIYYYKPLMLDWIKRNAAIIESKPFVFVTVSGAPPGAKLDRWLRDCLPPEFLARMQHVALQGRQDPKELGWVHWIMLKIAALFNPDREAAREEALGFDYVNQESIAPAVALIEGLKASEAFATD